jgi:hypothetical protein
MISRELAALPPAERTELIYRAARAGLDQQLWQAALGRSALPPAAAQPASGLPAHGPLKLDALVEALSAEDRLAPRLTSIPPAPAPPASSTPGSLRLGPNASFQPLLEQAARRTSLDPGLLAAIIDAEAARRPDGSWNPASRNPRSSASGLGQFLTGTWLDEARRPGSWLAGEAAARGWTNAGGALREGARSALLDLRFDPRASIEAIADHAAANLKRLRAAGVQADSLPDQARAAYLAHHLGIGDALRFLGGGLPEGRASRLLAAQVGEVAARRRITETGSAAAAHRTWLLAYVDRRIQPSRFIAA